MTKARKEQLKTDGSITGDVIEVDAGGEFQFTPNAKSLAETLAAGNTTNGTNIDFTLGSALLSSDGFITINDTLLVNESIILEETTVPATTATQGAIFIGNGTGAIANRPYYRPQNSGTIEQIFTDGGASPTLSQVLTSGNITGGSAGSHSIQFSADDNIELLGDGYDFSIAFSSVATTIGGEISLTAQTSLNGNGGLLNFSAGDAGTNGNGGNILLTTGLGFGSGNGGSFILTANSGGGFGIDGYIYLDLVTGGTESGSIIFQQDGVAFVIFDPNKGTTFSGTGSTLSLSELSSHSIAPSAGNGLIWVRNDTPNQLIFTDDDGVDWVLGGAGVADTLSEVLENGNITGGTAGSHTIKFSADDNIELLGDGYDFSISYSGLATTNSGSIFVTAQSTADANSDGGIITIASGAGGATSGQGGNVIITAAAGGSVSGTDGYIVLDLTSGGATSNNIKFQQNSSSFIEFAPEIITNIAQSGSMRLPFGFSINSRNVADTGDVQLMHTEGTNQLTFGDTGLTNIALVYGTNNAVIIAPGGTTAYQILRTRIRMFTSKYIDYDGDIDIRDGGTSIFTSNTSNYAILPQGILSIASGSGGIVQLQEAADHLVAPSAGQGLIWVRNDSPNQLIFTDDTGVDWVLGGSGIADTLSEVLENGNITGGIAGSHSIQFSADDNIELLGDGYDFLISYQGIATATGGSINVTAQDGYDTGNGGGITLTSGAGGATSGTDGSITLDLTTGGTTTGVVNISQNGTPYAIFNPIDSTQGNNVSLQFNTSSDVYIYQNNVSGTPPFLYLLGASNSGGAGGNVIMNAGDAATSTNAGGNIAFQGGRGGTGGTGGIGGNVYITAGLHGKFDVGAQDGSIIFLSGDLLGASQHLIDFIPTGSAQTSITQFDVTFGPNVGLVNINSSTQLNILTTDSASASASNLTITGGTSTEVASDGGSVTVTAGAGGSTSGTDGYITLDLTSGGANTSTIIFAKDTVPFMTWDPSASVNANIGTAAGNFTLQYESPAAAAGGAISIISQHGGGTGAGGAVNITAGNSGTGATGNGGAVNITAGNADSTGGQHGGINIISGGYGAGTKTGGLIEIIAGDGGTGGGRGGQVQIIGGTTYTAVGKGDVELTGGTGSGAGVTAGTATLLGGFASTGAHGGSVEVTSRNGSGTIANAGNVTITAGAGGSVSGTDGSVFINLTSGGANLGTIQLQQNSTTYAYWTTQLPIAGDVGFATSGGATDGTNFNIETEAGQVSGGSGGSYSLYTGNAFAAGNGSGGGVTLNAGDGYGSGTGGEFNVVAGSGGASGDGGAIYIASGAGGLGGTDGYVTFDLTTGGANSAKIQFSKDGVPFMSWDPSASLKATIAKDIGNFTLIHDPRTTDNDGSTFTIEAQAGYTKTSSSIGNGGDLVLIAGSGDFSSFNPKHGNLRLQGRPGSQQIDDTWIGNIKFDIIGYTGAVDTVAEIIGPTAGGGSGDLAGLGFSRFQLWQDVYFNFYRDTGTSSGELAITLADQPVFVTADDGGATKRVLNIAPIASVSPTALNVSFFDTTTGGYTDLQDMQYGIYWGNSSTAPTADPVSGMFMWTTSGTTFNLRGTAAANISSPNPLTVLTESSTSTSASDVAMTAGSTTQAASNGGSVTLTAGSGGATTGTDGYITLDLTSGGNTAGSIDFSSDGTPFMSFTPTVTTMTGTALNFIGSIDIRDDNTPIYTSSGTEAVIPQGIIFFGSGTDTAQGALRFPQSISNYIAARNEADSGTISLLRRNSSDDILVGGTAVGGVTRILAPSSITAQVTAGTVSTWDSGGLTMASGYNLDFVGTVDIRDDNTTIYGSTTGNIATIPQSILAFGTNYAGFGAIRLPNGSTYQIRWRNAANTDDAASMYAGTDDALVISGGGTAATVKVRANELELQTGIQLVFTDEIDIGRGALNTTYIQSTSSLSAVDLPLDVLRFGSSPADSGNQRVGSVFALNGASDTGLGSWTLLDWDTGDGYVLLVGDSTNTYTKIQAGSQIQMNPGGVSAGFWDNGGLTMASGYNLDFVGTVDIRDDNTSIFTSATGSRAVIPQAILDIGTGTEPSSGAIRFTSGIKTWITARNEADTATFAVLQRDASDNFLIGDTTNAASLELRTAGTTKILSGVTTVATWDTGGLTVSSGETIDFIGNIDIQDDGVTRISSDTANNYLDVPTLDGYTSFRNDGFNMVVISAYQGTNAPLIEFDGYSSQFGGLAAVSVDDTPIAGDATTLFVAGQTATLGGNGGDIVILGGNTNTAGGYESGNIYIRPGGGTNDGYGGNIYLDAISTKTGVFGNIAMLFNSGAEPSSSAGDFNGMEGGLFVASATTVPAGDPVGGAYWYVEAGASKARGTSGTITTFAAAEPHCPTCGKDAAQEWENPNGGWKLSYCMWCMSEGKDPTKLCVDGGCIIEKIGS